MGNRMGLYFPPMSHSAFATFVSYLANILLVSLLLRPGR